MEEPLPVAQQRGVQTTDQRVAGLSHEINWIWSPVSNLLLYRDTVDIRRLLERGVNVCLGSDWSPSGSKHVLDELKFARFVNQLLDLQISDRELFRMVTDNPARALGLTQSGSVREGGNADLFVLRRRKEGDALTALLDGSDADIDFVMVNGRIVFGLTRLARGKHQFGDQIRSGGVAEDCGCAVGALWFHGP